MKEQSSGMFNELDAIFKFPTLIDIASKKDRLTILDKDSSLIRYIKKPTEEEQLLSLKKDSNNLFLINNPSNKVILEMIQYDNSFIDLLNPIPEYVIDYIMDSSIDMMTKIYPSTYKLCINFFKRILRVIRKK